MYQGGNRLHLGFIGYLRGFEDNRWCTFNQIRDSGWHLKKGAKAAIIEKWREENEETGEKDVKACTLIIGRHNDVLEKRHEKDMECAPEKVSLKSERKAMTDAAKSHAEQAPQTVRIAGER